MRHPFSVGGLSVVNWLRRLMFFPIVWNNKYGRMWRQTYLKMIMNTGWRRVWPAQTDFFPSFHEDTNPVDLLRLRCIELFIYARRTGSRRFSGLDNRGKAVLVSNWSCLISWSTWKLVSVTIPLKLWCWGRSFIKIPPILRIALRKPTRFLVERG